MKQQLVKPELRNNLVYIKIPHGFEKPHVVYMTDQDKTPQQINHSHRLEIGHDYSIKNGYLISRRKDVMNSKFILFVNNNESKKKCKTCQKENSSGGSFCEHCGSFLF